MWQGLILTLKQLGEGWGGGEGGGWGHFDPPCGFSKNTFSKDTF